MTNDSPNATTDECRKAFEAWFENELGDTVTREQIAYDAWQAAYNSRPQASLEGLVEKLEAEKIGYKNPGMAVPELAPHQKGINCGLDKAIALVRAHGAAPKQPPAGEKE